MEAEKHIRPNSPISFSKKPVFRKDGDGMSGGRRVILSEERKYSISGVLSLLLLPLFMMLMVIAENWLKWTIELPTLIIMFAILWSASFLLGMFGILQKKKKRLFAILGIILNVGILAFFTFTTLWGVVWAITELFKSFRFGGHPFGS